LFAGTYSEFEEFEEPREGTPPPKNKGVQGLKEKLGMSKEEAKETADIIDAEFDHVTGEVLEAAEKFDEQVEEPEAEESMLGTIEFLMDSASTVRELMDAMKMAKDLSSDDKKKVSAMFNKRQTEIKANG
jgi:hypothetical protein